jgi:hypothetical protein
MVYVTSGTYMSPVFLCLVPRAVWYMSPLGLCVDALLMNFKETMPLLLKDLQARDISLFCILL